MGGCGLNPFGSGEKKRLGFCKDENESECRPYRASCSAGHKCWVINGNMKTNVWVSEPARYFQLTGGLTSFHHCRV
jgi:hypothetical protein